MGLLDQVLEHINLTAPRSPHGFDFRVLRQHKNNLIRIFNKGDCGWLAEVTEDGPWAYLSWCPTKEMSDLYESRR